MVFISFFIIYMFFLIIDTSLNYIVIPFEIYHLEYNIQNEENFTADDIIHYYFNNRIYFPIKVGFPEKNGAFILSNKTSGLNFSYSICSRFQFSNISKKFFEYSSENSTTYNLTSENIKIISNTLTGSQSTELFKFYKDIDIKETNKILINDLPFVYIPNVMQINYMMMGLFV